MSTIKLDNIVKIENTSDKDISFVPYGQNFFYTLIAGDTLEFRATNSQQLLYYIKQENKGFLTFSIDHFDGEPKTYNI